MSKGRREKRRWRKEENCMKAGRERERAYRVRDRFCRVRMGQNSEGSKEKFVLPVATVRTQEVLVATGRTNFSFDPSEF